MSEAAYFATSTRDPDLWVPGLSEHFGDLIRWDAAALPETTLWLHVVVRTLHDRKYVPAGVSGRMKAEDRDSRYWFLYSDEVEECNLLWVADSIAGKPEAFVELVRRADIEAWSMIGARITTGSYRMRTPEYWEQRKKRH